MGLTRPDSVRSKRPPAIWARSTWRRRPTNKAAPGAPSRSIAPYATARPGTRRYAVEGTPTDTVMMALTLLLDFRPDLVLSGINNGSNLGENIYYSGTVAAAAEAAKHGIASIAVSVAAQRDVDFRPAAEFVTRLGLRVLENGLPPRRGAQCERPSPTL